MKVNIVSYEDLGVWILGKFARKLNEEVNRAGIQCSIGKAPDPQADINHHIIYINYQCVATNIDTLMITHIDTLHKFQLLRRQLAVARMGVCMSRENQMKLIAEGAPADRLCYINPAHDEVMRPRPLTLGLTVKVHSDGRKNENSMLDLCAAISPEDFRFIIMGSGWQSVVEAMRKKGFQVEYYDDFNYETYKEIVPKFDYFLYTAHDEGSMGFMDALSAGVQTIVSPQGYHLDAPGGITHAVSDTAQLISVCREIAAKRRKLIASVADWTWPNYARKHIDLWQYLLKPGQPLSITVPGCRDGLASLISPENAPRSSIAERLSYKLGLLKNINRTIYNYFPDANGGVLDFLGKAFNRFKKLLSR